MKPIKTIVRIAPIKNSRPVVANMWTRVFSERLVIDLLRKMAATIANTKSNTRLRRIVAT
jgi:hypothetical protein